MKNTALKLLICSILFSFSVAPTQKDEKSWETLRNAAHQLGICIYQMDREICEEQLEMIEKLENKDNATEEEIHYFELKKAWAEKRIKDWAKKQKNSPSDFLILFDIDQGYISQRSSRTKMGNISNSFCMINLNNKFTFKKRMGKDNSILLNMESDQVNSVLANNLWREFMSGREGALIDAIEISVSGENAKAKILEFEEAFYEFQEKQD